MESPRNDVEVFEAHAAESVVYVLRRIFLVLAVHVGFGQAVVGCLCGSLAALGAGRPSRKGTWDRPS